jgi:hypothetical protein
MPRGNRTGPMGMGPQTGKAMGFCSGNAEPGFCWPGPGRGFGRGMGIRRGFGFFSAPQTLPQDELQILKNQAQALADQQKQIAQRIEDLEKKA